MTLICVLRLADFLRLCLSPRTTSRTISFSTTLAKKNRYSREIHEVDLQFDHVISCDIKPRFDIDWTRGSELADRSRCRTT